MRYTKRRYLKFNDFSEDSDDDSDSCNDRLVDAIINKNRYELADD